MADRQGAGAPAEPASETPLAATWRIGRFAIAGSLVISVVVHVLLIVPALVITSRLIQSEPATSVSVDLVTPDELAAMSEKPPAPEKAKQEEPVAAPTPPPASAQGAQVAALAGPPPLAIPEGNASEMRANLTDDDIAAFAAHVQTCWSASASLAKDGKLFVVLRVQLRRDGSVAGEPTPVAGAPSTLGPALVASAKRALLKCAPYGGLPAAKYNEWQALDLRFTGHGLSTAAPVGGPGTPRSG